MICGGSQIDSPVLIKKKKTTINPANVALNYEEIESYPEIVFNIKPFINKYKWKGINYPSKLDDWKTLEKNILTITPNIFNIK